MNDDKNISDNPPQANVKTVNAGCKTCVVLATQITPSASTRMRNFVPIAKARDHVWFPWTKPALAPRVLAGAIGAVFRRRPVPLRRNGPDCQEYGSNSMSRPIVNQNFEHPADGWYNIEARGEFPNSRASVVQVIDAAASESIVNRFNAAAAAPNFPGMLIDIEHFKHDDSKETRAYPHYR